MFIPLWITNNNNFFSLRLFHFEGPYHNFYKHCKIKNII